MTLAPRSKSRVPLYDATDLYYFEPVGAPQVAFDQELAVEHFIEEPQKISPKPKKTGRPRGGKERERVKQEIVQRRDDPDFQRLTRKGRIKALNTSSSSYDRAVHELAESPESHQKVTK